MRSRRRGIRAGGRWLAGVAALLVVLLIALPFAAKLRQFDEIPPGIDLGVLQQVTLLLSTSEDQPLPATDDLQRELERLGPAVIPIAIAVLCGQIRLPHDLCDGSGRAVHPLLIAERETLLGGFLRAQPPRRVTSVLTAHLTPESGLDLRLAVIHLMGTIRCPEALEGVLESAELIESMHLERPFVQAAIEGAIAEHLAADEKALDRLRSVFRAGETRLWPLVVRALGQGRSTRGGRLLVEVLGRSEATDTLALGELARLAARTWVRLGESALIDVRRMLSHPNPNTVRAAASALGSLRDSGSPPLLIALLESDDLRLSSVAHVSLKSLSAGDRGRTRQAWIEWYERELEWWQTDAPQRLEALHSDDPSATFTALAALLEHPLYVREAANAIGPLVAHVDSNIAGGAIDALERLGAPLGPPWLARALEREDALVARAHEALLDLTGFDLPPTAAAWQARLGVAEPE